MSKYASTALLLAVAMSLTAGTAPAGDNPETSTNTLLSVSVHPRSYYLHRHFDDLAQTQEAAAIGGWLDFRAGPWNGMSIVLTPYTSQRILGDKNKDGSGLLAAGQEGYSVLGQAYFEGQAYNSTVRLYRQKLETPFLNPFDVKMTPVTFEAWTLENRSVTNVYIMLSHVTGIKKYNSTAFQSMTDAAGISGTNRPVTIAGILYSPADGYSLQIWEYYCYDFINILYAQLDCSWKLFTDTRLSTSLQGIQQNNIGASMAGEFNTGMIGAQAVWEWRGLALIIATTMVSDDHDIVNPWGAYQGFTSIIEEDSNLAGENSWTAGVAYDFKGMGMPGLSASFYHSIAVIRNTDQSFGASPQKETDLTVDYRFSGKLNGLCLRFRTALVDDSIDTNLDSFDDYRFIINYDASNLISW